MKMKQEDFEALKQAIEALPFKPGHGLSDLRRAYQEAGKSHQRYRWDVLWAATVPSRTRHLYDYLNDDHIDTALRKILGSNYPEAK